MPFWNKPAINRDDYVEMSGNQLRRFCCKIIMAARYREDLFEVRDVIEHLIERHTPRPNGRHHGNNPKQNHHQGNQNQQKHGSGRPN